MASWWAGGLGNITGQITSLAKDVLTEGTEEVDDHEAALKIARGRIAELESQCALYRGEYEKSKTRVGELHDSLQSAELQLKASSVELRSIVAQKEAECALIRKKYEDLNAAHEQLLSEQATAAQLDQSLQRAAAAEGGGSTLHDAADGSNASHYQRLHAASSANSRNADRAPRAALFDSNDLDDVVLAQQEIDRLRSELQLTKAELQQQRQLRRASASPTQQQQHVLTSDDCGTQHLQQEIAELQTRLKAVADNHQHELAALQDVHSRRLADVRRVAQQQITDLENTVSSLQEQLDALSNGDLTSIPAAKVQIEAPVRDDGDGKSTKSSEQHPPELQNGTSSMRAVQPIVPSVGVKTTEIGTCTGDDEEGNDPFHLPYSDGSLLDSNRPSDAELREQVSLLETRIAAVQNEKIQLELQVASFNTTVADEEASLREENESLRASLDELDRQHEEAMKSLVLKRDELSQHNRQLVAELQEKQVALSSAITKVQIMEKEHTTLSARYSELDHRISEDADLLNQLRTQNVDLQQEIDNLQAQVFNFRAKLEAATEAEAKLSDRCRSLEEQTVSDRAEYETALARLRSDVALSTDLCEAWANATGKLASLLLLDRNLVADQNDISVKEQSGFEVAKGTRPNDLERCCIVVSKLVAAKPAQESLPETVTRSSLVATNDAHVGPDESHVSTTDADVQTTPDVDAALEHCRADLSRLRLLIGADLDAARQRLLATLKEGELKVDQLVVEVPCRAGVRPGHVDDPLDDSGNGEASAQLSDVAKETPCRRSQQLSPANSFEGIIGSTAEQLRVDVASLTSVLVSAFERLTKRQVCLVEQLAHELATMRRQSDSTEAQGKLEIEGAAGETSADVREQLVQCELELEQVRGQLTASEGTIEQLHAEAAESKMQLAEVGDELAVAREAIHALTAERDALLRGQQVDRGVVRSAHDAAAESGRRRIDSTAAPGTSASSRGHGSHAPAVADQSVMERDGSPEPLYYDGGDSRDAVSDEIKEIRQIIGEKDRVIGELRSTNGNLLRLLDGDQSAAAEAMVAATARSEHLRELDERLRSVEAELQRTSELLSAATVENRSLKAELHRMPDAAASGDSEGETGNKSRQRQVVAASLPPTPLAAMSRDDGAADELRDADESADDAMGREAVRKLANIIRDKDLEIEALKQKSATLVALLQEAGSSSNESRSSVAELAELQRERDHFSSEITLYQADRERLYAALQQKHEEASAYYNEAHRLREAVVGAVSERDAARQELAVLAARMEERQRELAAVGSELREAKRKLFDAVAAEAAASGVTSAAACSTGGDNDSADGSISDATATLSSFDAKCQEVVALKEKVRNQREAHLEKDRLVADLSGKVHQLETAIVVKEQEAAQLHQQVNRVRFELDSCRAELEESRAEAQRLGQRAGAHDSEADLLQEHNRKLLLLVREKEAELSHARERADSLERLLQEKQRGASAAAAAEESGLLAMCEASRRQALEAGQERDQAMLALQQRQADCQQLAAEVQACKAREKKVAAEAERLRAHLLRVEEGYTREALEAEEREKDLRNRLLAAEEKAFSSSAVIQAANAEGLKKVESLYEQLHAIAGQRDSALMQLASSQEQAYQYGQQLSNLQMVLEQFQRERDAWHAAEMEKLQRQLDEKVRELLIAKSSLADLQNRAVEQAEALEAAARLSQQLDRKEEALAAMRQEVQMREQSLLDAEEKVRQLTKASESKVDKQVIKSLMLGYLSVANNKRVDVLRLIAGVLEFSHEESIRAGLTDGAQPSAHGSWLSLGRLWRRTGSDTNAASPASTPAKSRNQDGSFSELFVKFLETESSPAAPQARLPIDRMIEEERRRHDVSRNNASNGTAVATVNPFKLPPVTGLVSGGGGSSQTGQASSLLVADFPLTVGLTAGGNSLVADSPLLLRGSPPVPAFVGGGAQPGAQQFVPAASRHFVPAAFDAIPTTGHRHTSFVTR